MSDYEKKYKEALDKAKRYDEVFNAAKEWYNNPNSSNIGKSYLYAVFPELKESEDEKIRKELIGFLRNIPNSNYTCEEMAHWLEKQGEQKSVDKAEPKFKVGNWIIDVQGVSANQIIGYEDDSYYIETSCSKFYLPMKLTEKNYRLWTIKDAKDGDIIYSKHNTESFEWIGIFKSLDKENKGAHFYGFWNNLTKTFKVCGNEFFVLYDDFSPATKEQRNMLMEAITEAGYEWDANELEAKKIENVQELAEKNLAWNENDDIMLHDIIDYFENGTVKLQHDLSLYASWLKFLKDGVKTHQEWTMQDEEELQIALDTLVKAGQHSSAKWLKNVCLVPQNKWKPSDTQMIVLNDVITNGHLSNANERILKGLQEQLKKLK